MAFPFYPVGMVVATLILVATLVVFVVALKALDRAVTEVGGTVLGSLVSGIRTWSPASSDDRAQTVSSPDDPIETAAPTPVERVRSRR